MAGTGGAGGHADGGRGGSQTSGTAPGGVPGQNNGNPGLGSTGGSEIGTAVSPTANGDGGGGGDGIVIGTLQGINLSGATNVSLSHTAVTAEIDRRNGGDGASGNPSDPRGPMTPGGNGGSGILNGTLYGIDLNGAGDISLGDTMVTTGMTGTGGSGGPGSIPDGSVVGAGGDGIVIGMLYGIELSGASDASLTDAAVTAEMTGTGGDGGLGNVLGNGGDGITDGTDLGIDLAGALPTITLETTTVTASMIGNGGDGGTLSATGGAGITGTSPFAWINPYPVLPPGRHADRPARLSRRWTGKQPRFSIGGGLSQCPFLGM